MPQCGEWADEASPLLRWGNIRLTCPETTKARKNFSNMSLFFRGSAGRKFGEPSASTSRPWFTGTLLSTRGWTLDQGHAVAQPYFSFTRDGGLYNDNWRLQSATASRTIIQQTYFIYGVMSRIDIEIAPQWLKNFSEGESFLRIRGLSASAWVFKH